MHKSISFWVSILFACMASVISAQAAQVYNVSSTSVKNCSNAPHGLWTNNHFAGQCANYFDIQAGAQFIFNNDDANSSNWTGTLTGTAKNPFGKIATIDFNLGGFAETGAYKKEGGVAYNPLTDTPDINFFTQLTGTIVIDNIAYAITTMAYNFQFGLGANAKTKHEYGGSAWLRAVGGTNNANRHWDVNLVFTDVHAPGGTGLILFGMTFLAGMRLSARRQKIARA